MDVEIDESVWGGRVPVVVQVTGADPLYVSLPRVGLLTMLRDKAKAHFARSDDESRVMWFDCAGVPLKWQVPIGVLYDMFSLNGSLPWTITAHFSVCDDDDDDH